MMNAPSPLVPAETYAAFEWWDAAGVDCVFSDDATAWFGSPDSAAPARVPLAAGKARGDGDGTIAHENDGGAPDITRIDLLGPEPPQDLAAFRRFWLEAPGLDLIGPRGRVPPRGQAGAKLMVLVIDPEPGDRERLLAGAQGRFLQAILRAIGIGDDEVYVASALPRHTPVPDTQAIADGGMDAVLAHHLHLARPQRVIGFGSGLAPLLGKDVTNCDTHLREINHTPANPPMLMCEGLDSLMISAQLKRRFWRRWIEWSGQD